MNSCHDASYVSHVEWRVFEITHTPVQLLANCLEPNFTLVSGLVAILRHDWLRTYGCACLIKNPEFATADPLYRAIKGESIRALTYVWVGLDERAIKGFRTIFTQSSGINMLLIPNVSFMPDRNSLQYQCVDADA